MTYKPAFKGFDKVCRKLKIGLVMRRLANDTRSDAENYGRDAILGVERRIRVQ